MIVGTATSAESNEAFVWQAETGMQSLQVLLAAQGLDMTGWRLFNATGVSADGMTVVGRAQTPGGTVEAFVATIALVPEPSTALLIGLGLAWISIRRTERVWR